jgi:hypothetical protein
LKTKLTILVCILFIHKLNAQWVQVATLNDDLRVISELVGQGLFVGVNSFGIFKSTNNGMTWIPTSLTNRSIYAMSPTGSYLFSGSDTYGVYVSTDGGFSWIPTALNDRSVYALGNSGNNIFAGTSQYGVYRSTNNGTSWVQTILNNRTVYSLESSGLYLFAGTEDNGVYCSANNGVSWFQTTLNNKSVFTMAPKVNYLYAGTMNHGVYKSTDYSSSWAQTSLNNETIFSLLIDGLNNLFAGSQGGLWVSHNGGTNWTLKNEGFERDENSGILPVRTLFISNNNIFAGVANKIYKRPLNELIGIQPVSNEVAEGYSLFQNYPNPFNPETTIRFSIPTNKDGSVSVLLKVFDILGKEIVSLVNESIKPGIYKVDWNASNFPGGVYFYTLQADEFTETKKMILIK